MNVSGRAELQRTVFLVVALLMTAGATGVFAREFRAADTRNEDHPTRDGAVDLNRTNVGLIGNTRSAHALAGLKDLRIHVPPSEPMSGMMHTPDAVPVEFPYGQVPAGLDTRPFEVAMTAVCASAQCDPDSAQSIERIRKVE
ncbi:MAG: hypothetical protein GY844_23055 [Bradyrhizobium sp.]|nr:hypothetical protein [Bradyrhizobium sp.]